MLVVNILLLKNAKRKERQVYSRFTKASIPISNMKQTNDLNFNKFSPSAMGISKQKYKFLIIITTIDRSLNHRFESISHYLLQKFTKHYNLIILFTAKNKLKWNDKYNQQRELLTTEGFQS